MINIPSFSWCVADSEKHDDSTLSRRLLTEIVREIDEGSFISKAIPDRAGSCEKQIPARRAGIVEHARVLARRPETEERRRDAALRKWLTGSCEGEKQVLWWQR